MATTQSSTSKGSARKTATSRSKSTSKRSSTSQRDAIQLLKADHREVEKLFDQFTKARSGERKLQLAARICMELRVHTEIEEEILYPASRDVLTDDDIVNEAIVEHQAAKDLIEQIEAMSDPSDEMFDAKMQVLQEQIEHHVEEEEKEYFPQLKKTDLDLKAIGEQLAARKKALTAQMQSDGAEMQ